MKAWALGTAIALIALTVGSVFGDRGILNLVGKRRQVEALRGELEGLRAENARLASEIARCARAPARSSVSRASSSVSPAPTRPCFSSARRTPPAVAEAGTSLGPLRGAPGMRFALDSRGRNALILGRVSTDELARRSESYRP